METLRITRGRAPCQCTQKFGLLGGSRAKPLYPPDVKRYGGRGSLYLVNLAGFLVVITALGRGCRRCGYRVYESDTSTKPNVSTELIRFTRLG